MSQLDEVAGQGVPTVEVVADDRVRLQVLVEEIHEEDGQGEGTGHLHVGEAHLAQEDEGIDLVVHQKARLSSQLLVVCTDQLGDRVVASPEQLLADLLLQAGVGIIVLQVTLTDEDTDVVGLAVAHVLGGQVLAVPHLLGCLNDQAAQFIADALLAGERLGDGDGAHREACGDIFERNHFLHRPHCIPTSSARKEHFCENILDVTERSHYYL